MQTEKIKRKRTHPGYVPVVNHTRQVNQTEANQSTAHMQPKTETNPLHKNLWK